MHDGVGACISHDPFRVRTGYTPLPSGPGIELQFPEPGAGRDIRGPGQDRVGGGMQRVELMLELVESGAAVTRDLRRPERMEQGASDHPPATRRGIDIFDGLDGFAVERVQQELPQLAQWIVLRSRLLL